MPWLSHRLAWSHRVHSDYHLERMHHGSSNNSRVSSSNQSLLCSKSSNRISSSNNNTTHNHSLPRQLWNKSLASPRLSSRLATQSHNSNQKSSLSKFSSPRPNKSQQRAIWPRLIRSVTRGINWPAFRIKIGVQIHQPLARLLKVMSLQVYISQSSPKKTLNEAMSIHYPSCKSQWSREGWAVMSLRDSRLVPLTKFNLQSPSSSSMTTSWPKSSSNSTSSTTLARLWQQKQKLVALHTRVWARNRLRTWCVTLKRSTRII